MKKLAVIEAEQSTALVTGATGAIGRRLCERLTATGWRVIGLATREQVVGPWERYIAADLAEGNVGSLSDQLAGEKISVFWHLAGKAHALAEITHDPHEYERINTEGTRTALSVALRLGARRFVLASSVKAMGEGGMTVLDETAPCAPATPYGCSKLKAEELVLAADPNLEPVVLRFCMVYGGADRGNMGRMLDAVRRKRFPPFPETGNRRSFVYIDDAVQACLLSGTHPAASRQVFLVSDGRPYSTAELYNAIRAALVLAPVGYTPPLWLFRVAANVGDVFGAVLRRRMPLDSSTLSKLTESAAYSPAKISRLLGYAPQWSLQRGLDNMVAGLRGQGWGA